MAGYTLIRSKRKTVSLQITKELEVLVRAPMRMSLAEIERFVESHGTWLSKHLARLEQESRERAAFTYSDGDRLPLAGSTLVIGTGEKPALRDGHLLLPADGRPEMVAEFLREQARRMTSESLERWAPLMDVRPAGVRITSARRRWGSCGGEGRICFSYRMACLPGELVDYVVVHELAHLREHNHSGRFWAVVERQLPDWRARRAGLREFSREIPF